MEMGAEEMGADTSKRRIVAVEGAGGRRLWWVNFAVHCLIAPVLVGIPGLLSLLPFYQRGSPSATVDDPHKLAEMYRLATGACVFHGMIIFLLCIFYFVQLGCCIHHNRSSIYFSGGVV